MAFLGKGEHIDASMFHANERKPCQIMHLWSDSKRAAACSVKTPDILHGSILQKQLNRMNN
jgi:hypothetical protein